ncbi:MAG: TonB-dependent receptor plug domain-containing protein [Rikenellaceae bacterium]
MNRWITALLSLIILAITPCAMAAQIEVKGVVKDSNMEAVAGAMILEKGTANGVKSDNKGNFEIVVKKGSSLYISHPDFEVSEAKVKAKGEVEIVLPRPSKSVNIGYGSADKKEITGSIVSLDEADLMGSANQLDFGEAMVGQVAGVSVSSDYSGLGESSQVVIRGYSSVYADSTPLYVVDGVPQDSVPVLSPGEIKSIQVLKDAASCAVYGIRGASGVILIETK